MPPAAPVLGSHVRKSLEIAAARPAFALGLRAAAATIVPLVAGEASGRPEFAWMALGGWLTAIVDPGGPHLIRAATMGAFAASGAAAVVAGTVASGTAWGAIPLLLAGAVVCSLARVWGDAAGAVGTAVLILLCITLGTPGAQLLLRTELFLAGCLVSMVLALFLWPVHAYRPAREAVAAAYRELAALAQLIADLPDDRERSWSETVLQHPPRVRAALERARAALGAVRRGRLAESNRGDQLVVLFELADVLLGGLIALGEALASAPAEDAGWLGPVARAFVGIAETVEDRAAPPAMEGASSGPPHSEIEALREKLYLHLEFALQAAAALREGAAPPGAVPEVTVQSATLRDVLALDSVLLRHALRVAATVAVAAGVAAVLGVVRAAWVTVAVVIVLQPDSGSTLRRAVQRVAGTVVGVLAAAVVVPFVNTPLRVGAVLFPLSALGMALRPLNYGLFTALITPVFLLMAETTSNDWHLARPRLVNTLIGAGLALVAQVLWPSHEDERLPERLALLFQRLREYLDLVLADPSSEPRARRAFGLAAANADASFQRHLGESAEPAERIEAFMAVLTYARRLRNSIALAAAQPGAPDLRARRPALEAALEELRDAARARRIPGPLPAIDGTSPAAMRLARQLEIIRSALERLASGTAPTTS